MLLTRRRFNLLLLAGLGTAALPIAAEELVEGRDWRPLPTPQPSDNEDKIEVLEFFSYGCPHCGDFNPLVKSWAADLPDDIDFRRVPVTFGRAAWEQLARLYHALEYTGELERLDQDVFDALHEQRRRLYSRKAILDWVADQGVDREAFATVFDSFGVQTRLARSEQLANRYQVNSVPLVVVGGRYVVVGKNATRFEDLLGIAEELIEKARTEAAKA